MRVPELWLDQTGRRQPAHLLQLFEYRTPAVLQFPNPVVMMINADDTGGFAEEHSPEEPQAFGASSVHPFRHGIGDDVRSVFSNPLLKFRPVLVRHYSDRIRSFRDQYLKPSPVLLNLLAFPRFCRSDYRSLVLGRLGSVLPSLQYLRAVELFVRAYGGKRRSFLPAFLPVFIRRGRACFRKGGR